MKLFLDTNDATQCPELKPQLEGRFRQTVEVCPLGESAGDLRIEVDSRLTIVFERKEVPSDLLASIADNRLFQQGERIPQICTHGILMLVGSLRYGHDDRVFAMRRNGWTETAWRKSSVEAALNRVAKQGMLVLREIHDYAAEVYQITDEAIHGKIHARKPAVYNPYAGPEQQKLDFLASLPGVGPKRAAALMDHYGKDESLWHLLTSALTFDPKSHPAGWGKATSKELCDFFGRGE